MKKIGKRTPGYRKNVWTGRGSMTVEAVFVMAILLLIFLWIMHQAIEMYEQTSALVKPDWIEVEGAAQRFRMIFLGKELIQ